MDVIKRGDFFFIYLPRTKEDKLKGNYPQVRVEALGHTTYTQAALERAAKRTEKRLAREQREAERVSA